MVVDKRVNDNVYSVLFVAFRKALITEFFFF